MSFVISRPNSVTRVGVRASGLY